MGQIYEGREMHKNGHIMGCFMCDIEHKAMKKDNPLENGLPEEEISSYLDCTLKKIIFENSIELWLYYYHLSDLNIK